MEKRRQALAFGPQEHNAVLLIAGLAFWAGCALARENCLEQWLMCMGMLLLAFLFRCLGLRPGLSLALCVLALGMARTLPALSPAAPAPGSYASVSGLVSGGCKAQKDGRSLTFRLTNVALDGVSQPNDAYCTAYADGEGLPELFDGAALRFSGRVSLPEGKSGAPRFDFARWMLQNRTPYAITISKGLTVCNGREGAPVTDWAYRARQAFRAALERVMGERADVAMAMLLGEKDGLRDEDYAAFQRLGIAHVMAVSGLHVGILGMLVALAASRLWKRRWAHLLPLGAFLAAYCALTGFSPSALRAAVMLMLLRLNWLWGRKGDPLTTLAAAMLAVLLLDPLQATSAGFVLSFSAVGGILVLAPGLQRRLNRLLPPLRRRPGKGFRAALSRLRARLRREGKAALSTSLAAQLGVVLPSALFFHSLPLYGVLLNLFVIPYAGLLVPLYGLTLLLSPVPALGKGAGALAAALSEGLLLAVRLLQNLPYASLRVGSPSFPWLAAGALLLLLVSHTLRGNRRRKLAAALLIAALAGASSYALRPPETRYVQLSTRQQDAALVFAGDQTVAIDVGTDGSAALEYLLDAGRDLDALLITHLHMDHAGGVDALLDAGIRIGRVYLPKGAEEQHVDARALETLKRLRESEIPVAYLARGDELRYNGVTVTALWPERDRVRPGHEANAMSLVVRVEMDGFALLNAGDLSGLYERYAAFPADVLKIAHHGSASSTSDAFLSAVRPRLALISCAGASAQLPSAAVLERLAAWDIPVLRTDETGDITLWVENGALHIAPYKERKDQ